MCINEKRLMDTKDEILDFFSRYSNEYDERLLALYKEAIISGRMVDRDLAQIYSKFDVLDGENDSFKIFANLLNKYKFLNTNCCEVAAGKYPRLAEIIYPTLKENNKSLIIYDPDIVIHSLYDIEIKKELFTETTDLTGIETLFGTFTCEATTTLVEKALNENKNLLVALCSCDHSSGKYPREFGEYWYESFCNILKKQYQGDISIINWPHDRFKMPIILRTTEEHKRKHLNL